MKQWTQTWEIWTADGGGCDWLYLQNTATCCGKEAKMLVVYNLCWKLNKGNIHCCLVRFPLFFPLIPLPYAGTFYPEVLESVLSVMIGSVWLNCTLNPWAFVHQKHNQP